MYKLAVIGNPVEHSLSPVIFAEFARQTAVSLEYKKLYSPIDTFEQVAENFFAAGGYALNITAPFKARAYALANQHCPQAMRSATANVLKKQDGLLLADNTDGLGLIADLNRNGIGLADKNILILGSGSVIHSILSSLQEQKPARIDLLMRSSDKLDEFMHKSVLIDAYADAISYDLVINTSPNIPENQLFAKVHSLNPAACAYDMIYTAAHTLFMQQMAHIRPDVLQLNGLGMLIQQARFGFNMMFGVEPSVDNVYSLLQSKAYV